LAFPMSAIAGLSISAIWHFLAILPIFSDGGAMTALLGDLSDFSFSRLPNLLNYQICNGDRGDSSFSRLPIYSITKSVMALPAIPHFPDYQFTQLPKSIMAIPAILFPAVIPSDAGAYATAREEPRGCLPHNCRCRECSPENVSAVPNRRATIVVSACHVERRAAQASRLGVETSRRCLRFHAASGNCCKDPGWSRHSCLR
jgi:hypothetical protein